MNLLTLFDLPETVERLSDEQILAHYKPYLHIIKPDAPARQANLDSVLSAADAKRSGSGAQSRAYVAKKLVTMAQDIMKKYQDMMASKANNKQQ